LKTTLELIAARLQHWRAGFSRPFAAIRKEAGLFCGSLMRKDEALAYVGLFQTLKDLNDTVIPQLRTLFGCSP